MCSWCWSSGQVWADSKTVDGRRRARALLLRSREESKLAKVEKTLWWPVRRRILSRQRLCDRGQGKESEQRKILAHELSAKSQLEIIKKAACLTLTRRLCVCCLSIRMIRHTHTNCHWWSEVWVERRKRQKKDCGQRCTSSGNVNNGKRT